MRFLRRWLAAFCISLIFAGVVPARAEGLRIIRDAEIEATLKTLAAPILERAGLSVKTVQFIIVDSPELNAFVAGGQNIFLYTGLLLKAENAEEIAGVIAHETGHIALGHLFRGRLESEKTSTQVLLASLMGVAVGAAARSGEAGFATIRAASGMAVNNALSHSRGQESSADQAGVRFLTGAHLSVSGLLGFMNKIKDQELLPEDMQSQYVRTHPLTEDRILFLENMVAGQSSAVQPAAWPGLYARMHAKLLGYLMPDQALQNKDQDINSRYGRALAWYRKGEPAPALSTIDSLLKQEPQNPYLYELQAQIFFEDGKISESLAPYAKAAALAPQSGLIRGAYGHALLEAAGDKNLKDAISQLREAVMLEPREAQFHYLLALAYGKHGEEGASRLHLAERYVLENRVDFARREAHLALKSLPKNTPAWQRAQDIVALLDAKKQGENKEKY